MVMPPIIIDTRSMMEQFDGLTAGNVEAMLDRVAKGLAVSFVQQLTMKAQQELKRTRQRYIRNIKLVDSGRMEGTVLLDYSKDKLVEMIEEGHAAFDMKDAMLASPKARTGKNGKKYLTIPFRWGVPGTIGESDNFTFVMPAEIHKAVKAKPFTVQTAGYGMNTTGLKFSEIPTQFQKNNVRPAIKGEDGKILFAQYESKSPVHQGIFKQMDAATGQNTYRSFRRVSENSDPEAFIHPGIKQYNLIQKTLGTFNIASEMTPLLDNELSKLGLI
jgi:hypothetical protein